MVSKDVADNMGLNLQDVNIAFNASTYDHYLELYP